MDHISLWAAAKSILAAGMNNLPFDTWINKPLKPFYYEDGELALEYIDELHGSQIRTRYLPMIENAVREAAGTNVRVRLLSVEERVAEQAKRRQEQRQTTEANPFNAKYTFDSFVVGSSNRLAHAAAQAVAENPGLAYNPLFLYGAAGLGKTHLIHAIGHYIHSHFPKLRIQYLPSETFMNELVTAIQKNTTQSFRERYRSLDVLMIDDIQFIAGRESTQEEFFHTFNALHNAGKQIIISSDRPPEAIAKLEERMRTRFGWGMVADIQKPDFDTKVAILRKKADEEHIEVSTDCLEEIAGHTKDSIRELEGALTRVSAFAKLNASPINEDVIAKALRNVGEIRDARSITPELIIEEVSRYYRQDPEQVKGTSRKKEIAQARHMSVYLIRELTALSLIDIGEAFGGRDHSTILSSINKIKKTIETGGDDPESRATRAAVTDLKKQIREG